MRAKRSKKYRKIMISYEQSFGHRPPFQVLLDSNFIRTCAAFHMPLQKSLENTLHGPCRLFVTKCTLAKILGDEKARRKGVGENESYRGGRPEWLPGSTDLPLRYCKHNEEEETVEEWKCLIDLVAGKPRGNEVAKNKEHFVLATAEAGEVEQRRKGFVEVRERARLVPGVPIVYVKRSVMVLEEFSRASEGVRRGLEREKFAEGILGGGGRKRKRGETNEEDREAQVDAGRAALMKKQKIKGPKQPNPLSVPKKKKVVEKDSTLIEEDEGYIQTELRHTTENLDEGEEPEETAAAPAKKGRKRRHGKKKAMDSFRDALLEPDENQTRNGIENPPSRLQDLVT